MCAAALLLSACATVPFPRLHVYPLPKPVTFAGERIPVNRPSVRVRISDWYNYYLTKPWIIARWLERGRQIFPFIDKALKRDGLPEDLRYVAVAESYLQPRAYSSAKAAGIWQFTPGTAKLYGLKINTYVDERYDYLAATNAAAAYFTNAKREIGGSWLLSVAAYNMGVYGVRQRIQRQKSKNFWNMVFPPQTSSYVPRIIAIKLVMQHAAKLGIHPNVRMPPLAPVTIDVQGRPVFLTDVAHYLGLTFRQVWVDNPQIWEPYLPPGSYRLFVPARVSGRAKSLADYLDGIPYQRAYYTSPGGETVAEAATILGMTADELATFNNLPTDYLLKKGKRVFYWRRLPFGSPVPPGTSSGQAERLPLPPVGHQKAPVPPKLPTP